MGNWVWWNFKFVHILCKLCSPKLIVKMDSKVRHWKYLGLILLWRYQGPLQVLPVQSNLVAKLAKNTEFRHFGWKCFHADHYSSATVMTLDLAMDIRHVETPLSVLPTEPLHDLNVLTLKSTCEIWIFFTTLDFGTKSPSRWRIVRTLNVCDIGSPKLIKALL